MYWFLPLTRGHHSWKATFLVQKGWPHKRGSTVFTIFIQWLIHGSTPNIINSSLPFFMWPRVVSCSIPVTHNLMKALFWNVIFLLSMWMYIYISGSLPVVNNDINHHEKSPIIRLNHAICVCVLKILIDIIIEFMTLTKRFCWTHTHIH